MSNDKRTIYRKEPIKKYKMHKVKKHWVVKGGVAGAMIVGSVGAPMVPHLAQAAETENVDPGAGEEAQAKSLKEVQEETPTVESTTTAVPEVTTETEAFTEESTKETMEEITESSEKTEDSKEKETKEKQTRAVENEDGTKTYKVSEDEGLALEQNSIHLINPDGTRAPVNYSGVDFQNGLHFEMKIDAEKFSSKKVIK